MLLFSQIDLESPLHLHVFCSQTNLEPPLCPLLSSLLRKQQRMRDARRQMVEEAEERQRNLEEALKDPNKAKLYRQLQETMPDVPISMK